ncbi:2-pyrone-4,6-dicarboxylate hydrolase [Aliidongia dinghuensis]|uniref:2-pyrone-4,6-dicarboxylate hydrolase n=1 Tax=Aliidongia dinghuensis TaxID=1867774 RepID=A0A8J2YUK0_9PROT|nr:amidohydrolase family protein [Aliidongia dinghuensis]GGF23048.1 2-pyrone-4,6-dicarboxylate hydrolase [Aliidongia dinghuensis]
MPDAAPSLAAPELIASAGACDCHIHVYDSTKPLAPTASGPGPAWATVAAYRAVQRRLGLGRAVVVQPTAYGTDNSVTVEAIAALGLETTRGIATVGPDITDEELQRLTEAGIRGARFQMLPGGALPWEALQPVAARIAPFGWHIQLQMDGRLLAERELQLRRLPTALVIDHVGKFLEPVSVDHPGFRALLRLVDSGRAWLKLAAAYEVSKAGPPRYDDVGALAKAAVAAAPERMIWASNWPHVSVRDLPDDAAQLDLLLDWAPDAAIRKRILVENPAILYGF